MNAVPPGAAAALVAVVLAARAVRAARAARGRRRLRPAAARAPAQRLAVVGGVGAVVVVVAVAAPVAGVLLALGALVGGRYRSRARQRQAARRDATHLPELAEGVARSLRAGRSPAQAMARAATQVPAGGLLAVELAAMGLAIRRGLPVTTALDRWARVSSVDGAGLVAAALVVALSAGGDGARALDGVAATLRDRAMLQREVEALSSQARASAVVLAVAPVGFAAVAAAADPATLELLLGSPVGGVCLAVGVALDVAGWRWMAAITGSVR